MSQLKNSIRQTIVAPATESRRQAATLARVTDVNEKNNTCSIEFIDKDGYKSNKDNVPVKILLPGFIGWFPKRNEAVNVDVDEYGNPVITSKYDGGYSVNIRPTLQMKKDILSSSFNDTMGGYIF